MKFSDLSIGDKISIKIQRSDGSFAPTSYNSKIEDINLPNKIMISSPSTENLKKWVDKKVEISITSQDAAFVCIGKIERQTHENYVYLLEIKVLSELQRTQRREFYRLNIRLDVEVIDIGKVKTVDISGNGICLRFDDNSLIKDRSTIMGIIDLDGQKVEFLGKIIRIQKVTENEKDFYTVHIKFLDLSPYYQNQIAKFVYKQQIIMRRKNLI